MEIVTLNATILRAGKTQAAKGGGNIGFHGVWVEDTGL